MDQCLNVLKNVSPLFDDLVITYFKSILEDIPVDVDEINFAIGDFIREALPQMDTALVEQICLNIFQLLLEHGEKSDTKTEMLDSPIDMQAFSKRLNSNTSRDTISTEFFNRNLNVDKKKLAKAEKKMKQKMSKRLKVDPNDELQQFTATQASSRPDTTNSYDINIHEFDLSYGSRVLLKNASIVLSAGRRYGIVGRNGYGKTTFLRALYNRDISIQSHITVLHVEQEVEGDDTNIVESVLNAHTIRNNLLTQETSVNEQITLFEKDGKDTSELNEQLANIYNQLDAIGASEFESTVCSILHGLGFSTEMQSQPTRNFSGGWRMRLALARALFLKPDLLLLDEPTNMLDLKAIMWLQQYLENWSKTILIVSHDKVFLDAIATDIIHLTNYQLIPYRGNYSTFEKTKNEKQLHQQREYESQMAYREHLQTFIDRFRANANRASQAQSKIKILEKLPQLQAVEEEPPVVINMNYLVRFADCERVGGTLIKLDEVAFGYSNNKMIIEGVNLSASYGSKITIVGDNGSGKTTLLKILAGILEPVNGFRTLNRNAHIGYFSQHHVDQLNMSQSALEILHLKFPNASEGECRGHLSSFGLTGDIATRPVLTLSGGQKSRAALAILAMSKPNLLVLDEPTNHLDIETVEALSKAIQTFQGGVILVSHNEFLIRKATNELWLCKNGVVSIYRSGIEGYVDTLRRYNSR